MNKIKIGFLISLFGLSALSCTEEQDAKLKNDVFKLKDEVKRLLIILQVKKLTYLT